MAPVFAAVREEYAALWSNMALHPSWVRAFERDAQRILRYRDRYEKVSAATGVPWFVIGLIHSMESGLDFDTHLHNGDSLSDRTVHVPRGRPQSGKPPFTWEESAVDALGHDGLTGISNWCVEQIAYMLEAYNGWGYHYKRIPTPYLWSGTNNYERGKYVRDGQFDPNAVSEQTGAMAILSVMRDLEAEIQLTFFNGADAAHEPTTVVLPPEGTVAQKPRSTIPPDALTVISGAGAVAVAVSHSSPPATTPVAPAPAAPASTPPATPATTPPPAAPPVTPPAAPPTPSAPAPSAPAPSAPAPSAPAPSTAAPSAPATSAPPATAAKPAAPPVKTAPPAAVTVQPTHPSLIDTYYPVIFGGLIVLFLIGVVLSWRARSGRARSAQTFGTAVPELLSRAASGRDISSAPLVRSLHARLFTLAWVVLTIAVNAIALAKLLQYFRLAPADWYPPFSSFGNLYDTLSAQAFTVLVNAAHSTLGVDISPWPWLMPFLVIYLSTASAFMVANAGLMQRRTTGESLWGAVVHAGWLLALPTFLLDAVRYRVVDRFARQNTVLFFAYIAAFAFAYIGARFVNDDFLAPYVRQHPQAAAAIEQAVQTNVAPIVTAAGR
jgi:lysozyme family protein/outer membrane biosynthesis protein TonB